MAHAEFPKNCVILWLPGGTLDLGGVLNWFRVALILLLSTGVGFVVADDLFLTGSLASLSSDGRFLWIGDVFWDRPQSMGRPSVATSSSLTFLSFLSPELKSLLLSFVCEGFAKKLAIFDLFCLLYKGMTKLGESLPTLPTSLETG